MVSQGELGRLLDLPSLFGRSAPVELEIGFGNGEFLSRESLAHPERDYLGIEIAWPSVKRALRRLGGPPRGNVRVLCLPAATALARFLSPRSLSLVRALFPVPWPKCERKRIFSRAFLDAVANRLRDDGALELITDDRDLALWTLGQAEGSALGMGMEERGALANTKYERKWESLGKARFFHLRGRKLSHPDPPEPEPTPMKPLVAKGLDTSSYRPRGLSGEISVVFRELVFDRERGEGLLNCKVVEDSFVQEFFIRLTATGEPGCYRLFPALSARVIPTEGVRLALRLAAQAEDDGP
jgi:tRNA (guanine-N7-)-methyltransferase